MSTRPRIEFHVLCTFNDEPTLMRVVAENGKDALTYASRVATNLVVLFATRSKETDMKPHG
jgi:hypothetical protein